VKARFGAAIIMAALLSLGASGCALITPQATTKEVEVANGVNGSVGQIDIRNATIISDNGKDGSLLVSFYNASGEDQELAVQYESHGTKSQQIVRVASSGLTSFGNKGETQLVLEGIATPPGSLLTIFFQYGTAEGVDLKVPVLTSDFEEYTGLAPTPVVTPTVIPSHEAPTAPTATPEPTQ
jgi:hypothetical protein